MRAALTGSSLRTPLGHDVGTVVRRLLAGEHAARPVAGIPAGRGLCAVAGRIEGEPACTSHRKFLDRLELFAIDASRQALGARRVCAERLGIFVATGGLRVRWDDLMPALARQEPDANRCWDRGLRSLHPFWLLRYLSNNVHALLSADLGATGEGATFGGANAGAQAIASAARALAAHAVDVALVVSYDALTGPEALLSGTRSGALTTSPVDRLRPAYDAAAEGGYPGEAAAALILERPGAEGALTVVEAWSTADGQPGLPRADTLSHALGQVVPCTAVLVDGSGQARPASDTEERAVLAATLGEGVQLMCLQAATGQLGAATAAVQAIVLGELLRRRLVPQVAGLREVTGPPPRPQGGSATSSARAAIGIGMGAPGLLGVVRLEAP